MKKKLLLTFGIILLIIMAACAPAQVNIVDEQPTATDTPILISPTNTTEIIPTATDIPQATNTPIVIVPTTVPTTEVVWNLEFSAAEEQGMDSGLLDEMVAIVNEEYPGVESILIARNGKTVLDEYFSPFREGQVHRIYSGTKSILSILIGIAIDEGFIESVDVRLVDLFPDAEIAYMGELKEAITLKHLMSMTSGMRCLDADTYGLDWWVDFMNRPDWVSTFLDQPMVSVPGDEFYYCDGTANLMSAILQDAVEMSLYTFANRYLFEPLGIEEIYWHQVGGGYYNGSTGIHILPEDFAKIGSLILSGGRWQGEQIVSEEWVRNSTSKYIEGTFSDWFGYYWWIDNEGYISAFGLGNQLLYIIPDESLIVVIFCDPERGSYYNIFAEEILEELILPAIIR